MVKIDYYVVKFPSVRCPGDWVYYHLYKTRVSARKACKHLIDDLGFDAALIVSINNHHGNIKEEVFL